MGVRLTAAACALALTLAAPLAFADVELEGDLRGIDARVLDDLVRLELGSATVVDRIVVSVAARRAEIEVAAKDRRQRGTVALPEGHAERTIALFVGELARRLAAEPEAPAASPVTAAEPPQTLPPTAPQAEAPRTPTPAARPRSGGEPAAVQPYVLATFGARLLAESTLLLTSRIEGGLTALGPVRVGVLARHGYTSADDPLGSVQAHALTGGLTASWTTDVIATGPRIEIGALAAKGDGENASSTTALATSAAWELELRAHVPGWLSVIFAVEAGWYMRGLELRADDRTVVELHGPFAGASIGAGSTPKVERRNSVTPW